MKVVSGHSERDDDLFSPQKDFPKSASFQLSLPLQRNTVSVSEDHMVGHLDAHDLARLDDLLSDGRIGFEWWEVARRTIQRQDLGDRRTWSYLFFRDDQRQFVPVFGRQQHAV